MTDKNIQIRDLSGNNLFPKTLGTMVQNTDGTNTWNLGGVEAGAQVNVVETVKVNGTALTPDANKAVNVVIPDAAEYTITKATTADEGYFATYQLFKDSTAVGDKINIPKDFLVKSASMKVCETANVPVTVPALAVGDPYLDFVVNTKDGSATDEHLYINVKGLVDVYTAGNGLDLNNGEFSVDTTDTTIVDTTPTENSTKFVQSGGVYTALASKVDANAAITGATKCKITYDEKGLVTAGADLSAADIPNLASSKITAMTGYTKASSAAAISTSDSINEAIGKLEYKVDNKQDTITGAATTIVANDLTASMILASDTNGKVAATAIPSNTAFLTYVELT